MTVIFDSTARRYFEANYPETPHRLRHQLHNHPLLTIEALACLGDRLPQEAGQFGRGDSSNGVERVSSPVTGMTIGDIILDVEHNASWSKLSNIGQISEYRGLLSGMMAELKPHIEEKTGKLLSPQGTIFVSSPYALTPYRFDPEHRIIIQLSGSKMVTHFPTGDTHLTDDRTLANTHLAENLHGVPHTRSFSGVTEWSLSAGQAIFLPFKAPHYTRNGPEVSISLVLSWHSEWRFAQEVVRAFNSILRKAGGGPAETRHFSNQHKMKAMTFHMMRKSRTG